MAMSVGRLTFQIGLGILTLFCDKYIPRILQRLLPGELRMKINLRIVNSNSLRLSRQIFIRWLLSPLQQYAISNRYGG